MSDQTGDPPSPDQDNSNPFSSFAPLPIAPIDVDSSALAVRAYPIGLDPRQMQPSGVRKGQFYPLQNPGPIFHTPEDAAYDINSQMNPISVADNAEYDWGYYQDPNTGLYGYTDPYNFGPVGGKGPVATAVNGAAFHPSGLMGWGHTHGDYSDSNSHRTPQIKDYWDSDNFSAADRDFSRGGGGYGWGFFTVGTPSGRVLQWTPQNGPSVLFENSF
jgi:hypothetical protein